MRIERLTWCSAEGPAGFYRMRSGRRLEAIGLRLPFTCVDLRLVLRGPECGAVAFPVREVQEQRHRDEMQEAMIRVLTRAEGGRMPTAEEIAAYGRRVQVDKWTTMYYWRGHPVLRETRRRDMSKSRVVEV
jgi:hypothetical protein